MLPRQYPTQTIYSFSTVVSFLIGIDSVPLQTNDEGELGFPSYNSRIFPLMKKNSVLQVLIISESFIQ